MPTSYTVRTHETGCKIITGEHGIPLADLAALFHAWTKDRPKCESAEQINADPMVSDAQLAVALEAAAVIGRLSQINELRRQVGQEAFPSGQIAKAMASPQPGAGQKEGDSNRILAAERDSAATWKKRAEKAEKKLCDMMANVALNDVLTSRVERFNKERETLAAQVNDLARKRVQAEGQAMQLMAQVAMLREALDDFIHNVEHSHVYGGASVREDGCYHRLKTARDITPESAGKELAELREDKARLDWLRHGYKIGCDEGAVGHADLWYVYDIDWSRPLGSGSTLRAAIDAARKEAAE